MGRGIKALLSHASAVSSTAKLAAARETILRLEDQVAELTARARVGDDKRKATILASFDERAYLAANPDVRQAVVDGTFASGRAHYIDCGYREGRRTASRATEVLKYISKAMQGIEIGPYFNPIAPKRAGYNCLSLDVVATEELRSWAARDPDLSNDVIKDIEEVDLIGSATEIVDIVRRALGDERLDYIISAHNFEHLPNPIRFLQGCEKVIKRGGHLSMVLPDFRCCFDFFRTPTMLGEWLDAYFSQRVRPTARQSFEHNFTQCRAKVGNGERVAFPMQTSRSAIKVLSNLSECYNEWARFVQAPDETYRDAHCSTFTPASFQLLIGELRFLGLIGFECVETVGSGVDEFYVHLQQTEGSRSEVSAEEFHKWREELLHHVVEDIAARA